MNARVFVPNVNAPVFVPSFASAPAVSVVAVPAPPVVVPAPMVPVSAPVAVVQAAVAVVPAPAVSVPAPVVSVLEAAPQAQQPEPVSPPKQETVAVPSGEPTNQIGEITIHKNYFCATHDYAVIFLLNVGVSFAGKSLIEFGRLANLGINNRSRQDRPLLSQQAAFYTVHK